MAKKKAPKGVGGTTPAPAVVPQAAPAPEVQGAKLAHKVWSGTLTFGLVSCPVSLSTAAREERVSFNQLHGACGSRLKQQDMRCPTCDVSVGRDQVVKGYEYAKDSYCVLTAEEIAAAETVGAKVVEVAKFVPATQIDPVQFEASFYVAPGDGGAQAYALLREGMVRRGVVGIARLVKSGREHICAIRPVPGGLMLHTLFWAHEVRLNAFPALPGVSGEAVALAEKLVDAYTGEWSPAEYREEYRESLLALIHAKAAGQPAAFQPRPAARAAVPDILAALKASLDATKAA